MVKSFKKRNCHLPERLARNQNATELSPSIDLGDKERGGQTYLLMVNE